MTAFTWSGTFGAFAKMCQLRLAADTQEETRHIARQVYAYLERQFPVAAPLFVHGG
jgi:thymidylate synthase ThyX